MTRPLLEIDGIETFYGRSQVLFGLAMSVGEGEIVTLLGRNGMGKTTALRSIMGLKRPARGSVRLGGTELAGAPAYRVARHGLALVPEGRQVFPNLTVREHLVIAQANRAATSEPWNVERVFALFPRLAERSRHLGHQLSGGEQQMLAIGRALVTNPRLLLLDEATEGLAPLMRAEIWRCLAALKAAGQAILLVDKNVAALTRLAERHVILEKGRVAWTGSSAELARDRAVQHRYLGV